MIRCVYAVPFVMFVSCASRKDNDLFDSTPSQSLGARSSGGRDSQGGSSSGGQSVQAGGGIAPIPVPEAGNGGADPNGGEPEGGEPGQSPPGTTGGTTSGGGGGSPNGGGPDPSGGSPTTAGNSGSGGNAPMPAGGTGASSGSGVGGAEPCVAADEICDGSDNDCDGDQDEGAVCADGCHGFRALDMAYMVCPSAAALSLSRSTCTDHGMHLAWVESDEENQALLHAIAKIMNVDPASTAPGETQAQVRFGASDLQEEGHWFWSWGADDARIPFWEHDDSLLSAAWEGSAVDGRYSNWSQRRPNDGAGIGEDCLVMELQNGVDGDAGQWNDVECGTLQSFVCELR
jgi:hypothetical protein